MLIERLEKYKNEVVFLRGLLLKRWEEFVGDETLCDGEHYKDIAKIARKYLEIHRSLLMLESLIEVYKSIAKTNENDS